MDAVGEYELLALPFDGTKPRFTASAKKQRVDSRELTVYYGAQCPFTADCAAQVGAYCGANGVPCKLVRVDTLEKAKAVPCVFNNWAVFRGGKFETTLLLNENSLKRLLESHE